MTELIKDIKKMQEKEEGKDLKKMMKIHLILTMIWQLLKLHQKKP